MIQKLIDAHGKDIVLLILGAAIGYVISLFITGPLTIVPALLLVVMSWGAIVVPLLKRHLPKYPFVVLSTVFLVIMLAVVLTVYAVKTPYFFGTPRLRGLVHGIRVPASDFSWSTNGAVLATPILESGSVPMMKVDMTLRGDKPCADAGWGIDLIRWDWSTFTTTYDPSLLSKAEVMFYVRGETGKEKIGVSMKSDRDIPSPSGAESEEEKVPLSSLGVTVTQHWQRVSVPFARLYSFDKHRTRNLAFYTDADLMKSVGDSQTIYLRDITFLGESK